MVLEQYLSKLAASRRSQILETLKQFPPPPHFWKVVNLRWLRGFVQGDGTFNVCFLHRKDLKKSIYIQLEFGITQHKMSMYTLLGARILLGTGQIYFGNDGICGFKVTSKAELNQKIVNVFFQKGGFFGQTQFRYTLLSQILLSNYRGVSPIQLKNFIEIVNVTLRTSNNYRRYTQTQLFLFMEERIRRCSINNIQEKYQNNKLIPWYQSSMCEQFVSGFTDAEGCFLITLMQNISQWPIVQPHLEFRLCAASSEEQILNLINKKFFQGQGKIYFINKNRVVELRFTTLKQILEFIIPFFLLNPTISSKYYDFEKFATVAYMRKAKKHKSIKGMEKIIELAFQSNTGKGGQQSKRYHSKIQYFQFLSVAPNKQIWKDMLPTLPSLKKKIMVSRLKQTQ